MSRKDKRRLNLEGKVSKLKSSFVEGRDEHYRDRLTKLQTNLTTLHQGNNLQYMRSLRDLEEARDLELVRLRLFEEYRVSRSSVEFQEDIERAKEDHEKLIRLCKERLYASIEAKIRRLHEERLFMDVANVHSYSTDYGRPQYQKNTRSHSSVPESSVEPSRVSMTSSLMNSTNYSAPGGVSSTAAGSGWDSSPNDHAPNNDSATDTGNERRSLRRRGATPVATTANSEESEYASMSISVAAPTPKVHPGRPGRPGRPRIKPKNELQLDAEFMQGISDNPDLHAFLFGDQPKVTNVYQSTVHGSSLVTVNQGSGNTSERNGGSNGPSSSNKKKYRGTQRYSAKPAPPLQSLTPEEVTSDINLIREMAGLPSTAFKSTGISAGNSAVLATDK